MEMYTEYVHVTPEESELKLGKIKGFYVTVDNWKTTKKTKMFVIKKVIDLEKEIVESIGMGKFDTINE